MKSEVACEKRLKIIAYTSKINSLETDTAVLEYLCNDSNDIKKLQDSFVKI